MRLKFRKHKRSDYKGLEPIGVGRESEIFNRRIRTSIVRKNNIIFFIISGSELQKITSIKPLRSSQWAFSPIFS